MLAFGTEPHSALFSLVPLKPSKHGHIKCLEVLIEAKLIPPPKDYFLAQRDGQPAILKFSR